MNYLKIYDTLIIRAKLRILNTYTETHHIVPRCQGGSNDCNNLVNLTPEEHYVAHQLLTKIYPNDRKLAFAASMMCCGRTTNKLYGWIRRRISQFQKTKHLSGGSPTQDKRWVSSEHSTMLVHKDRALELINTGEFISGKKAVRAACGHLVRKRCVSCENLPKKAYQKRSENGKELAYKLFNEFLASGCASVTQFAKIKNTSQPRLTMLWKRHVKEYVDKCQHGKPLSKLVSVD